MKDMKQNGMTSIHNCGGNFRPSWGGLLLAGCLFGTLSPVMTSCDDFFDQTSSHLIFADDASLNHASDTIYSVLGIVNKIQALADRTILLGEMRGDLVDVTSVTSSDLRDVATFNVGDDNVYNVPRDYYAVINNCNFFLAHADTLLKNNNNDYIFRREYAAVKAFRAWTYMQLALNYGSVPFVTAPILTKDDAEREYERKNIRQICEYFVADLAPYVNEGIPQYGMLHNNTVDSRLFYFPIHILLGDMNLWLGNYKEAALCYYRYLSTREGTNSVSYTGLAMAYWGDASWMFTGDSYNIRVFGSETYTADNELITMIPCDSIPAQGNYSQLRNLYNSTNANDNKVSIVPSQALKDLSAAQVYCFLTDDNRPVYPTGGLGKRDGDLRLDCVTNPISFSYTGSLLDDMQYIAKYATPNVHLYRRSMVYLRMAEALNRAGYPRFAYQILETGVNNQIIEDSVIRPPKQDPEVEVFCNEYADAAVRHHYRRDSVWLRQFNFPNTSYVLARNNNYTNNANTMGLHSRGSGWTASNEFYNMPQNPDLSGEELVQWQMEQVEDLIMDEEALEFSFEGHRYYDLMRVALRRNDPSYLANRIYARRGADRVNEVRALIRKDLNVEANWYLDWSGKIGL